MSVNPTPCQPTALQTYLDEMFRLENFYDGRIPPAEMRRLREKLKAAEEKP